MKLAVHWAAFLLLMSGILVPSYLGLQFTEFVVFLACSVATAVVTLVALRFLYTAMPLDRSLNTNDMDAE